MRRLLSLLLVLTMILNLGSITAFAADEITINIIYPTDSSQQKTSYSPGDTVLIRGTSPEKIDLVLRVIDNKGKIIHTDTILASENTKSLNPPQVGKVEYSFTFTLPDGPSAGDYNYNIAVGNESYNATAVMKVNVPKPPRSGGGGGYIPPTPTTSAKWTDPIEELTKDIFQAETKEEAVTKINEFSKNLEEEQKKDPDMLEKVATIVEAITGNLNAKIVSTKNNTLNITQKTFDSSQLSKVDETMSLIKEAIAQNKFELNRELQKELILKVTFDKTKKATIVIDPRTIEVLNDIDVLTIADEEFHVSFIVEELKEQLGDNEKLEIYIEKENVTTNLVASTSTQIASNTLPINLLGSMLAATSKVNQTAYKVSFNKEKLKNNVKISLPSRSNKDTQYQAVIKIDGSNQEVVGGKYNAITGLHDFPINNSGTYVVRENKVDFSDIANKDAAMQEAIKVLASKGIIDGTGDGKYSPDSTITRAEVSKLFVKTLYTQKSGEAFSDIKVSDWYKTYAESARAAGIIKGLPGNIFGGNLTISKDQIMAIASRTLVEKKKYKVPQDIEKYLQFADRKEISEWALPEISLANREGLIIKRTDNKFNGAVGMTRGEVALIMKKLFDRL